MVLGIDKRSQLVDAGAVGAVGAPIGKQGVLAQRVCEPCQLPLVIVTIGGEITPVIIKSAVFAKPAKQTLK